VPELVGSPGGGRIHALDAAASDARSLVRRAGRLSEKLEALENPELQGLAAEQLEVCERMLAQLEKGRVQERMHMRRALRGAPEDESA
jgi:hypothetical protein